MDSHEELPGEANCQVFLRSGARVKQLRNGNVAVRGERNRRAGMARGALILGRLVALLGGIDYAQGDLSGREYVGETIGNVAVGAAIGYLISPHGWQQLPPNRSSGPAD